MTDAANVPTALDQKPADDRVFLTLDSKAALSLWFFDGSVAFRVDRLEGMPAPATLDRRTRILLRALLEVGLEAVDELDERARTDSDLR